MRSLGVDVDLTGRPGTPAPHKDPALMGPDETVEGLVLLSVGHNIRMMHMLSNERKFGNIIEAARSTKDWKQLRAYLNVFQEYFTYLSVRQKTQALSFLYELLVHREATSAARRPTSSAGSSPCSTWSTARSSPTT